MFSGCNNSSTVASYPHVSVAFEFVGGRAEAGATHEVGQQRDILVRHDGNLPSFDGY